MKKLIIILTGGFSLFILLPSYNASELLNVKITWSFSENTPSDHVVEFADTTFTVPAGKTQTIVAELRGGSNGNFIFATRGWGFLGQKLLVDGKEVPPSRITRFNEKGRMIIFDIHRAPWSICV